MIPYPVPCLMILLFFFSCGLSTEEKIKQTISSANVSLSKKKCKDAIDLLEGLGVQASNAQYLQTLASAHACRAGYTEPAFIAKNLSKVQSSPDAFFGSLTKFTTSDMTNPADAKFIYLQTAIDILLYAGDLSDPNAKSRAQIFNDTDATNINLQLLFMILTQLGKYVYFYGNADPVQGKKGLGNESNGNTNNFTNGCFYDYDPINTSFKLVIDIARATSGKLGSCTTSATGHPKLIALPNSNTVKRMCQGVVLFNNFLDVLSNLNIPKIGDQLKLVGKQFDEVCSSEKGVGDICTVKNQVFCETDYGAVPQTDVLQLYYFLIYENFFK